MSWSDVYQQVEKTVRVPMSIFKFDKKSDVKFLEKDPKVQRVTFLALCDVYVGWKFKINPTTADESSLLCSPTGYKKVVDVLENPSGAEVVGFKPCIGVTSPDCIPCDSDGAQRLADVVSAALDSKKLQSVAWTWYTDVQDARGRAPREGAQVFLEVYPFLSNEDDMMDYFYGELMHLKDTKARVMKGLLTKFKGVCRTHTGTKRGYHVYNVDAMKTILERHPNITGPQIWDASVVFLANTFDDIPDSRVVGLAVYHELVLLLSGDAKVYEDNRNFDLDLFLKASGGLLDKVRVDGLAGIKRHFKEVMDREDVVDKMMVGSHKPHAYMTDKERELFHGVTCSVRQPMTPLKRKTMTMEE